MVKNKPAKDKDKDKEALFNVTYNVTDNISSRAILRHNNIFKRYLTALGWLVVRSVRLATHRQTVD